MGSYEFMKLGQVERVQGLKQGDQVLLAREGRVYRVDPEQIRGFGGCLLSPAPEEVVTTRETVYITTECDDLILALGEGGHVTIRLDGGSLNEDYAGIEMFLSPEVWLGLDDEMETQMGCRLAAMMRILGSDVMLCFTNGDPVPTGSTVNALAGGGENGV